MRQFPAYLVEDAPSRNIQIPTSPFVGFLFFRWKCRSAPGHLLENSKLKGPRRKGGRGPHDCVQDFPISHAVRSRSASRSDRSAYTNFLPFSPPRVRGFFPWSQAIDHASRELPQHQNFWSGPQFAEYVTCGCFPSLRRNYRFKLGITLRTWFLSSNSLPRFIVSLNCILFLRLTVNLPLQSF